MCVSIDQGRHCKERRSINDTVGLKGRVPPRSDKNNMLPINADITTEAQPFLGHRNDECVGNE